jgi:hypothetical protein
MRPNVTNWTVGGSSVDQTGGVITGPPGPYPSWQTSGTTVPVATNGSPISYQAVVIVAAPNTSTPLIGRMKIDEIKGTVTVLSPANAGRVSVGVAIYVSEFNSNTGKWDVRDPLNTSDAARDDYFFFEAQMADMPAAGTATAPAAMCFHLKLANSLIIGGGQALHVTVSYLNSAAGNALLLAAFRTRVGPVA